MKKFLFFIFMFFIFALPSFSADKSEMCTLIFYNNDEVIKAQKSYDEIAPILEKIMMNSFDINLNLLLTDKSVEDMKNVGTHLEILLPAERVFPSQNSHLSYIAYKTFIVKENGTMNSLPLTKIFLTFQDMPLVRGIGSIEMNPRIVNVNQRRIRVITGDVNGYSSTPKFSYGTDGEYKRLLELSFK